MVPGLVSCSVIGAIKTSFGNNAVPSASAAASLPVLGVRHSRALLLADSRECQPLQDAHGFY